MDSEKTGRQPKFRKWLRTHKRLTTLLVLLLLAGLCWVVPGGQETVRKGFGAITGAGASEVILKGTPAEMGRAHGKACTMSIKLLCNVYVKSVVCGGSKERYLVKAKQAQSVFGRIDERWTEEVKAVAQSSGAHPKLLMLGNTFLDLGLADAGCRSLVTKTPQGMLHAHNMDWDNLGGVGNYLVTIFRTAATDDRLATVYIAFPGMVGALDVINEKGIALSFNQLGRGSKICKMPVFIKMREIAETCDSYEKAVKAIKTMPEGMPFCITLSDAVSNQAAVFERDRQGVVRQRGMSSGIITADNNMWCGRQMTGRCRVDDVARELKPQNIKGVKSLLRHSDVLAGFNIYSVIFDHKNNSLYVAAGEIPAANGTYRKYVLFKQ